MKIARKLYLSNINNRFKQINYNNISKCYFSSSNNNNNILEVYQILLKLSLTLYPKLSKILKVKILLTIILPVLTKKVQLRIAFLVKMHLLQNSHNNLITSKIHNNYTIYKCKNCNCNNISNNSYSKNRQ